MLRKLLQYRNDTFTSEEDIRLNQFHNGFLLFLSGWGIAVPLLLVANYIYLMSIDSERYAYLFNWFIGPSAIYLINPIATFFLRFRLRDPFRLSYIAIIIQAAMLSIIGILIPQKALVFLAAFTAIPQPFFLVKHSDQRSMFVVSGLVSLCAAVVIAMTFMYPKLLDIPNGLLEFWAPIITTAFVLVLYQIAWIGRSGEQRYLRRIKKAQAETEEAYSKVKARDARIQNELDFAADLQRSVIPHEHPQGAYYTIYTNVIPYGKVTGDYVDVLSSTKSTLFLLADASGHGVSAALLTMVARQAFHDSVNKHETPGDILNELNKALFEVVQTTDYLTAFLAKLETGGLLTFSAGAHPPGLLVSASNHQIELLESEGSIIGMVDEQLAAFQNRSVQLSPGDRLVLYTDGLTEQTNSLGEEFGLERLEQQIAETAALGHREFHDGLFQFWQRFIGHDNFGDDITLMSVEYTRPTGP